VALVVPRAVRPQDHASAITVTVLVRPVQPSFSPDTPLCCIAILQPGDRVVERSAGDGNIAVEIRAAGSEADVVEISG
jgi:hypothetical protein